MQRLLMFFLLQLGLALQICTAQEISTGKVVDDKSAPIKGVEVSIDNRLDFTTNARGEFNFILKGVNPSQIVARKQGYRLKTWNYDENSKLLHITMQAATAATLKGQLVNMQNQPLAGAKIILDGVSSLSTATTNSKGNFTIQLPAEANPDKIGFIVNGALLSKSNISFNDKQDFVTLKSDLKAATEPSVTEEKPVKPKPSPKPVINIELYDERDRPLQGIEVFINKVKYTTDEHGEFQLKGAVTDNIKFDIPGYTIIRRDSDENDIYLYIRKTEPADPTDSLNAHNYREDFHRLVDQLELKKQLLAEKSLHIREEIEAITSKLRREPPISEDQRIRLKQYLRTLEQALIESEVAFEEAEEKTQTVVDRMKAVIVEQDSVNLLTIKKLELSEAEKRVFKLELAIIAVVAIAMLLLSVVFYRNARRIARQSNEISKQKLEIEHAYDNIKTLGEIGQKITSALDFKSLVQTVNANILPLIDAPAFGVGIFNKIEQKIEFMDFVEKSGNTQFYHYESMSDHSRLSVWCIKNQQPVIISNVDDEYRRFLPATVELDTREMPKSLIYLPLIVEGKAMGVITVQNPRAYAYKDVDVKILQTLASYVSVALANTNAYQVIKSKNKHITDSIRYAQTIQQAILPSEKQMSEIFPEHFVIYRPKDIVSGDFYWLDHVIEDSLVYGHIEKTFLAVIDCTGHGVPGGFMSMVGNHLLSEIVNVKKVYDPALVLQLLNNRVKEALKQHEKVNDDGMDVCLCMLEKINDGREKTRVVFAGAKRPLYYYRKADGQLHQLKGDRASIGGMSNLEDISFENQELLLEPGDFIYLTTDGISDQNDANRQKFTTQRLKELFSSNAAQTAPVQKTLLEEALDAHMLGVEQRDDITIVGIGT